MTDTCDTCTFWLDEPFLKTSAGHFGKCRRYPAYEHRNDKEWCGEFKRESQPGSVPVDVAEIAKVAVEPRGAEVPRVARQVLPSNPDHLGGGPGRDADRGGPTPGVASGTRIAGHARRKGGKPDGDGGIVR